MHRYYYYELFNQDGVVLTATVLLHNNNNNTTNTHSLSATITTASKNNNTSSLHSDDDDDDDDDGIVWTLSLNRHTEKNVINPHMISLICQALDIVENPPPLTMMNNININTVNKALLITGLSVAVPPSLSLLDDHDHDGNHLTSSTHSTNKNDEADHYSSTKFFCNGLDLQWMLQATTTDSNNTSSSLSSNTTNTNNNTNNIISDMIERFNSHILARILILPFRTIAVINGHCIGAGLFLALSCDYRIMRTEKGYIQWPEARLGMRVTKGFMELCKAKLSLSSSSSSSSSHLLREGILTAKRYTPSEALAAGIVDAIYPIEKLYNCAIIEWAMAGLPTSRRGMNLEYFDPKTYSEIKIELYTDAYRALKFGKIGDLPESRI